MAKPTLIEARYTLPVRPAGTVLEWHTVVVDAGRIAAVLPTDEARADYPDADRVALDDHVLLPGLVNMHTHAPMTLFRGVADDRDMQSWLREGIWPLESHYVDHGFVLDGTRLAVAEMLRGGTTCFNELYFFPDAIADVARASGMRACIGLPIIEMETAWAPDAEACIERGLELTDRFSTDPRIGFSLGPHAPYTVGDRTLERIAELASDRNLPVHMHLLETAWEVRHSRQEHGAAPLQRLDRLGLLSPRLLAVHMTQLSGHDIRLVAERGVNVIHCAESNLKLASGMCPVAELLRAGVNVAIGTDGAASNNDLDLLAEARTAALLAKGLSADARAVTAGAVIDMLTINAAEALGMADRIGSIEAGKRADLAALNLRYLRTQPVLDATSTVVYAASSNQFTDVWVDGERLLMDGELQTLDEDEIIAMAEQWSRRLLARVALPRPQTAA